MRALTWMTRNSHWAGFGVFHTTSRRDSGCRVVCWATIFDWQNYLNGPTIWIRISLPENFALKRNFSTKFMKLIFKLLQIVIIQLTRWRHRDWRWSGQIKEISQAVSNYKQDKERSICPHLDHQIRTIFLMKPLSVIPSLFFVFLEYTNVLFVCSLRNL